MMSVTSSALTILFLFWSISYLIKQQGELDEDPITINEAFKIFGSSALGCLTFTFTDSFWFNAVEAEVYAMATLILSLLFWLGLKWIDNLDSVIIGDHCCVSQGALLICGNHDYTKITFDLVVKPIVLEDGVWIGAKSVVCPGVVARTHAILTAGSTISKDMQAYSIYRGNPAEKVKSRDIKQ